MNTEKTKVPGNNDSHRGRKFYIVGIGPGNPLDRTARAVNAIKASDVIVGYSKYIENIKDLISDKKIISTGMTKEIERCREAIKHAVAGNTVALISSGDPGIYGMAGLAIEMAEAEDVEISIEVVPGVTAASAAAASLGAPLMLDFACISLSDILVPWNMIKERLEAVSKADMVIVLYNPRSKKRVKHLEEAKEIIIKYRTGSTPVGVVTKAMDNEANMVISSLDEFLNLEIGMSSTVIIGNKSSEKIGSWFITPRGYKVGD